MLTATGATLAATEGAPFSGAVASFTDANPLATAGEFSATIAWDDGQTGAGTVQANTSGGFDILGTHTYSQAGAEHVAVVIADVGGSTASASSSINFSKATPVITWSNPADIVYGVPLSTTQLDATASVPGSFT
jgi:hypothetical protein